MKTISGLTVDHVFESYIPALSQEERQQLEDNLIEHGGARDPLVVWHREDTSDVLLDGHNRYEICERLGLPYDVKRLMFKTRDEAADWIDRNQLGRRNLSKQDYKLLLGRRYNRAKKSVSNPEGKNQHDEDGGKSYHQPKTCERIAKEHGVTEKTVRNAGKFQEAAAKLRIEQDIAAGKVKATEAAVVKAAAALWEKPTAEDVERAVSELRKSSARRQKGTRKAGDIFRQYPPTKCIEAVEFYVTEFLARCPNRMQELKSVLVRLIASCDATK